MLRRCHTVTKTEVRIETTTRRVETVALYSNRPLIHYLGILLGTTVEVRVLNGDIYEGVFSTISTEGDVVLEAACRTFNNRFPPELDIDPSFDVHRSPMLDRIVLRRNFVILLTAKNVNISSAGGFTDSAISRYSSSRIVMRDLSPWEGPDSSDNDFNLEELAGAVGGSIHSNNVGANGWAASEMFRTNKEKYGVESSYDGTLPQYTIPLVKQNTKEYLNREQLASQLAKEIESDSAHIARLSLECSDEYDNMSSVLRNDENSFRSVPNFRSLSKLDVEDIQRVNDAQAALELSLFSINEDGLVQRNSNINPNISFSSGINSNSLLPNSNNIPVPDTATRDFHGSTDCSYAGFETHPHQTYASNFQYPRVDEYQKTEVNFQNTTENNYKVAQAASSLTQSSASMELSDIVKNSTLNPNAKEFTFNPNAKCFTPRSFSENISPAPSTVVPHQTILPISHSHVLPSGQQIFTDYSQQYAVPNTHMPLSSYSSSYQQPSGRNALGQDLHPVLQVSASTGQPLFVPNPISNVNTVNFSPSNMSTGSLSSQSTGHVAQVTPHSIQQVGPTGQGFTHPQVPYIVGPRVMSQQPLNMTTCEVPYCDSNHLNSHNFGV